MGVDSRLSRRAAVGGTPFDPVDHVVMYLFGDPTGQALEAFFSLGAALRMAGRMPLTLPSVELGGYRVDTAVAASRVAVSADVLPWRPATGVYLLLEEGAAAPVTLVEVPGVAGMWTLLGENAIHPRLAQTAGRRLTVCYLDGDPVATAQRIRPVVRTRWERGESVPLMAAPMLALS